MRLTIEPRAAGDRAQVEEAEADGPGGAVGVVDREPREPGPQADQPEHEQHDGGEEDRTRDRTTDVDELRLPRRRSAVLPLRHAQPRVLVLEDLPP
jgi:hypothetical protein